MAGSVYDHVPIIFSAVACLLEEKTLVRPDTTSSPDAPSPITLFRTLPKSICACTDGAVIKAISSMAIVLICFLIILRLMVIL